MTDKLIIHIYRELEECRTYDELNDAWLRFYKLAKNPNIKTVSEFIRCYINFKRAHMWPIYDKSAIAGIVPQLEMHCYNKRKTRYSLYASFRMHPISELKRNWWAVGRAYVTVDAEDVFHTLHRIPFAAVSDCYKIATNKFNESEFLSSGLLDIRNVDYFC